MFKKTFILVAAIALTATLFGGCGSIGVGSVRISEKDITPFNSISVSSSSTRIELVESDGYGLDILVPDRFAPEWDVTGGRLTIRENAAWFNSGWNIFPRNHYIKVYYPAGTAFTGISLASASGRIELSRADVADLRIESASGRINAKAESAGNVSVESSSGDITFSGSGGNVRIISQSGAVQAVSDNCDALSVTTSSGRITLTGKGDTPTALSVNTQSGRVDIKGGSWRDVTARTSSGGANISGKMLGSAFVETASGSVQISVDGSLSEFGYSLTSSSGSIRLQGERMAKPAQSAGSFDNNINVVTSSGGIRVDFTNR